MEKRKSYAKYFAIAVPALIWLSGKFARKLLNVIELWNYEGDYSNEIGFRKSLAKHIRKHCPNYFVLEEDGSERRRADIRVANFRNPDTPFYKKIAIEIKYKLSKNTELDRLIGQVVGYKEHGYVCAIVIAVEPEPNFEELLIKKLDIEGLDDFLEVVVFRENKE